MFNFLKLLMLVLSLVFTASSCDAKSSKNGEKKTDSLSRVSSGELVVASSDESGSVSPQVSSREDVVIAGEEVVSVFVGNAVKVIQFARSQELSKSKLDFSGLFSAGVPIPILYDRVRSYLALDDFNRVSKEEKKVFLDKVGKNLVKLFNLSQSNLTESGEEYTEDFGEALANDLISSTSDSIWSVIGGKESSSKKANEFIKKCASNYFTKFTSFSGNNSFEVLGSRSNVSSNRAANKFCLFSATTPYGVGYYYNGNFSSYKDLSIATYTNLENLPSFVLRTDLFSQEENSESSDLKSGVYVDWYHAYEGSDGTSNKGYLRKMLVDGTVYLSAENFKHLFNNGSSAGESILGKVAEVHIFVKKFPKKSSNLCNTFTHSNGYVLNFKRKDKGFSFKQLNRIADNGAVSKVTAGTNRIVAEDFLSKSLYNVHYVTPSRIICSSCGPGINKEDGVLEVSCGSKNKESCEKDSSNLAAEKKVCMTVDTNGECSGEISYKEFVPVSGSVLYLSAIDAVEDFQKLYKTK